MHRDGRPVGDESRIGRFAQCVAKFLTKNNASSALKMRLRSAPDLPRYVRHPILHRLTIPPSRITPIMLGDELPYTSFRGENRGTFLLCPHRAPSPTESPFISSRWRSCRH